MLRSLVLFFLVIGFFGHGSFAQPYLHVKHKRNLFYKVGDEITLLLDGRKTTGEIAAFTDSSFFFQNNREIPISRIETIYRKNPRNSSITKVYIAAVALPVIDLANNGRPVGDSIWKISAILGTSALVLQLLHKRRIRIKNKSSLRILKSV
ncbi:MAG: hypothetical protein AAF551_08065 [Bacteroidota bacterium]